MKISGLHKDLIEAIYIDDCHVTGMHDPTHTTKYVCDIQFRKLAERVLSIVYDVDFEIIYNLEIDRELRIKELNKIPRKINKHGWYKTYLESSPDRAKELEDWELNGFKV